MYCISKVYMYICRASNEASNQKHHKMTTLQARFLKKGSTITVREIYELNNHNKEITELQTPLCPKGAVYGVYHGNTLKKSPVFEVLNVEEYNKGTKRINGFPRAMGCVAVTVKGMSEKIYFTRTQTVKILN